MLSLRAGFHDFQSTIEDCRQRLDHYGQELSNCQQNTESHDEAIQQYQSRIENYQTELHRFGDAVDQFETRARELEIHFTDQNSRIKQLESADNSEFERRLAEQVEKTRNLETEIRGELKAKQVKFTDDLNLLRHTLETSVESLGSDLMAHLNEEMGQAAKLNSEKGAATNRVLSDLSTEFSQLNQLIAAEVNTLREESHELREQNRELQHQNHLVHTEQSQKNAGYDLALDDVKHRLQNYQKLIEDQIDSDQSYELSHRISSLESNIENQRHLLTNYESSQTDLTDKLETATETNKNLNSAIIDSDKTNRHLLDSNNQLQQKLKETLKERETIMRQYGHRVDRLEEREQEYQKTITGLTSRESDTNMTLQQMRVAMKDSTRAMRETQKTLEKFQVGEKSKNRSWFENSKQAVVSSIVAVVFTSLTLFGIQQVDASINTVVTNQQVESREVFRPITPPVFSQLFSSSDEDSLLPLIRDRAGLQTAEFLWPVNFGVVDPNVIRYERYRRGISITAEMGDPVVAVNDGTVIYSANEIRGYGNIILIQHKDNLVSVYANNQFNYVKEGDRVHRGQLIGDIGQLFNDNKAGLYFEMRYMGMPEDPFNYLSQGPIVDKPSRSKNS